VSVNGEKTKLVIRETQDGEISRNSDCYVIVYAVNDYKSFDFAVTFLGRLVKYCKISRKPSKMILVGNKSDLARNRQVQTKEGRNIAMLYGAKFVETGSGIGHNIDQLLVGIVIQSRLQRKQKHLHDRGALKDMMKSILILPRKLSQKKKRVMNLNI